MKLNPLLGVVLVSGLVFSATLAVAVELRSGDLVVTEIGVSCGDAEALDGVFLVDPITGDRTAIATGGDFACPSGVTLTPDGDIVVADQLAFDSSGAIFRVDPSSGTQTTVTSGGYLSLPFRVAIDEDGSWVIVNIGVGPGDGNGSIVRVDPNTGAQTLVASGGLLSDSSAVVIDPNGDFLVADFDNGLIRVDRDTGTQELVLSSSTGLVDMTPAQDGEILALASFERAILQIDPETGWFSVITQGMNLGPVADGSIALEPNGGIIVVDRFCCGGAGPFIRVDPQTGLQTVFESAGFQNPFGLAVVGLLDGDGDGIPDEVDVCADTVIPEGVPTHTLGVNRWALVDEDGTFDTTPPPGGGGGPDFEFTVDDTRGCSCEQIIEAWNLGLGHTKFGCSTGVMLQWIADVWNS